MSEHEAAQPQINNGNRQLPVEEMTLVQFIAVSAEELARMVTKGELPPAVNGADVIMQNTNNESHRVSINYAIVNSCLI